ncbi:ABC transporter substrate-binding protein [Corynebacterium sp. 320]|uniref:metal ABC transporter solute-binding protein, Zn/Mn family n=1 Tax=Corynebacterium TaxID=1716 RepID=UPI00125CBE2A|nr:MULTISPECIES: zinc ABC transporter substrate-binding protein [Corynebacterium]KAB1503028.1 ABC transporter substrate-binding protein [Corynebacterium sp. 320]KAB1550763.1 ABC transporter substrate-binding protein [Corynebacterium sp. 321]KAB1551120.1 ABC transporter substrate-binding protein [Corynebacterium sp. 319]KAB3526825.1 ABC transporter substrate-binding protein [Corynebacterium sp. 250]KAB3538318.1 ABC transporter substrate-binding protein [Corynebacterium sp. 366]
MKKTMTALALLSTLGLTLASCSDGGSSDPAKGNDHINIVASVSTWGSIAKTLVEGNDNITVTTILDNNQDDPHEYEASAKDLATLSSADIVVANGGGYDNWLTDHVEGQTPIVSATELTEGHHHHHHDHDGEHEHEHEHGHDHGGFNPHIWFNMTIVDHFVEQLKDAIEKIDPDASINTSAVTDKTHEFAERMGTLKDKNVILTESVAEGIIDQSDLKDITPDGYADSVARESEPSAADVAEAQKLINDGKADILITNEQSHTAAANTLIEAAKSHKTPIVNVNETPDNGQDYFGYVDTVINDLEEASK